MEGLRQYILSIITVALICSILATLTEDTAGKGLIRMLCGLLLTVTALVPIYRMDLKDIWDYEQFFPMDAADAVSAGEKLALDAAGNIIKQQAEAYILDKAAQMGAAITAEVSLNTDNIPLEAVIHGTISPYIKMRLEEILESDLGITKENQIWSG